LHKTLTATLRLLAKRWLMLSAELKEINVALDRLTSQSAKRLRNQFGVYHRIFQDDTPQNHRLI
jgi:hypothetical protein